MKEREPGELTFTSILLDTLLIIGAVACVLTIDRGRWITSNPAFYQPANAMVMDPSLMANTEVFSAADPDMGIIPQTGGNCLAQESAASGEWYETYKMLSVFHSIDQPQDMQPGADIMIGCGK